MRKTISIDALAIIAVMLVAGCEKEEGKGVLLGDVFTYMPFPQHPNEIPNPDTLAYYPYDPNVNIPVRLAELNLTSYPEPDSTDLDSADLADWIPMDSAMPPISEFLAMPRTIPAETTLARLLELEEDTSNGMIMVTRMNNCDFSKNKRGDMLLTYGVWYLHIYGYWTHSLLWRGSKTDNAEYENKECITAHWSPGKPSRNGVHLEDQDFVWGNYPRCAIYRVNTSPKPTSLRSQATDYVEAQLSKPYNLLINWKYRQDKFYCSQLNWAGYWYKSGHEVDVDINKPDTIRINQQGDVQNPLIIIPDWHVLPDELVLSGRLFLIAKDP